MSDLHLAELAAAAGQIGRHLDRIAATLERAERTPRSVTLAVADDAGLQTLVVTIFRAMVDAANENRTK